MAGVEIDRRIQSRLVGKLRRNVKRWGKSGWWLDVCRKDGQNICYNPPESSRKLCSVWFNGFNPHLPQSREKHQELLSDMMQVVLKVRGETEKWERVDEDMRCVSDQWRRRRGETEQWGGERDAEMETWGEGSPSGSFICPHMQWKDSNPCIHLM